MGIVEQKLLVVVFIVILLLIVFLCNIKYWMQAYRKKRWPKVEDAYCNIVLKCTSDNGAHYSMLGLLIWDRISKIIEDSEDEYVSLGSKHFKHIIQKRVNSAIEDIKEENARAVRYRINKEYKEYLERRENNDTN